MTVELFIELLTIFSIVTGLMVESEKAIAEEQGISYAPNLMALVTALIIGTAGTWTYYALAGIALTSQNVICMILMGLASGLCSMVGFDKMKQLVAQLK